MLELALDVCTDHDCLHRIAQEVADHAHAARLVHVRKLVHEWLGHELVELSAEGRSSGDAAEQGRELFARLDGELRDLGLSLDNTVRSRVWGRDRPSRDAGSRERVTALSGA